MTKELQEKTDDHEHRLTVLETNLGTLKKVFYGALALVGFGISATLEVLGWRQ